MPPLLSAALPAAAALLDRKGAPHRAPLPAL